MRIVRKHRISIDLDTKNQFELLRRYFNMRLSTNVLIVKQTKHGYHLLGEFLNRSPDMNLHMRRVFGDCPNRIEMDEARLMHGETEIIETLFSAKYIDGKWSYEEDYNIMSMPFWSVRNHI